MDWTALVGLGLQLAQSGVTYATANAAQKQALDALAKAQKNIGNTSAMFDAVGTPNYTPIDPKSTQLGDTELKSVTVDPAGKLAEQQALAELQQIADAGGLSLSDMKALNDIQRGLNQNNQARQLSTANQFAARGQLGSGAQLAMALRGNQDDAMRANDAGEAAAAQAQQRAMQAIASKATMGRQMSEDDYNKKSKAAEAADLIKQRNMTNSIGAQQYNNNLLGQGFDDRFNVARGKAGLLPAMNENALMTGAQNQQGTLAKGKLASDMIGAGADAWGKFSASKDKKTSAPPMVAADPPADTIEWNDYPGTDSTSLADLEDDK